MPQNSNMLEHAITKNIHTILHHNEFVSAQSVRFKHTEIDLVFLHLASRKLFSIEVKRYQWRNTFMQARRNLNYVHFSYAALPETLRPFICVASFRDAGIGLIFFDQGEGSFRLKVRLPAQHSAIIERRLKKETYSAIARGNSIDV